MCSERPFDPLADLFVRSLLGAEENKDLLINFINAVFSEKGFNPIVSLDILNPYNLKEYLSDKESILDIKARDKQGRTINIEVQIADYGAFANRSLYYWARNYQKQLKVAEIYTTLTPVACINLINFIIFPDLDDFHTCFHVTEKDKPDYILTEHLQIHFIELPKMHLGTARETKFKDDLEKWCYYFKNEGYQEEDEMPVLLKDNEPIQKAHRFYEQFAADAAKMDMLEAREKWIKDHLTGLHTSWQRGHKEGLDEGWKEGLDEGRKEGLDEGRKEGLDEGRKEGLDEGRKERAIEIAKGFKQSGILADIISQNTGLTLEEIENLG